MELHNIERLIDKYNNAETTLQEEAQLRDYFLKDDVAQHLAHYAPLFTYFAHSKNDAYTKDISLQPKQKIVWYQWLSVAAAIIIMLGIVLPGTLDNNTPKTLADYTPEEQALYNETKRALAMLSSNFNQGTSSLNALNMASENFNAGLYKASFVSAFGKSTNKLLK